MSSRKKVLQILEENKGQAISGQELGQTLGVSRGAIWKAIKSLQEEGHLIDASSGKGYSLSNDSDFLSEEGIKPYLNEPVPIHVYETIDSTNKKATAMAMDNPANYTTIIANEQTNGRGRLGRSFYSPKDSGLYMSILIKPTVDISQSVLITTAVSVAVCKAIEKVTSKVPAIKWVNDIYVEEKKVCGILTEAITDFETGDLHHIAVGIGVNCFTEDFPESAGPLAGSILGKFSKNQLAAEIINQVIIVTENLEERTFIDYYKNHSFILGKKILTYRVGNNEGIPALAREIDENGALIIERNNGDTEILTTGEVTIRLGGNNEK